MTMTKQALIDSIQQELNATGGGISKAQVEAVLHSYARVAAAGLKAGTAVPLPGLGKLKAAHRAARSGRNPATGEALAIPAKTVAKLAASKALEDALN